jgi:hypothetical protein
MIKVKITDPAGTPESQKALNVLTATIQIDTEETERA